MTSDVGAVWDVEDAELLVRASDGGVRKLTADIIFRHVFRQPDPLLPSIASAGIAEELRFSRLPLTPCIEAGFFPDSDFEGPEVRVVAMYPDRQHAVTIPRISEGMSDHIVLHGVWYPFAQGTLEGMRKILVEGELAANGPITLRQYIMLRNLASDNPLVRIRVDSDREVTLSPPPVQHMQVVAKLYPYQERGIRWLMSLARERLGGILADEMGLGKTLQVIALLASAPDTLPALVVVPATLLENWRREIERFAPTLQVLLHHGSYRTGFPDELKRVDVVIASYDTIVRDQALFEMLEWGTVVLDEAQNVRNPDALRTATVKALPRTIGIAVTGTPVENRLEDLWSLLDFAVPGFLGTREEFISNYENTPADARRIAAIAGPFVLRRKVAEVAGDLPPRIDIPQLLKLPHWLAEEYDEIRRQLTEEYGPSAGFAGLVRLRQFCTHPFLLSGRQGDPALYSPKYLRLCEVLEEVADCGEKALVFTSFRGMVDILAWDLPRRLGIACDMIDGRTPVSERQVRVDGFSSATTPAVLILNPQAGGTGLNISAANHVVHFNPEWNPATQDQASARAHRRGQTRPVTIHQFYYSGTVEEVMIERLSRKRAIASSAIPADADSADHADIVRALERSPLERIEKEARHDP
jgi:SNF2 family DNA or RNA helicase